MSEITDAKLQAWLSPTSPIPTHEEMVALVTEVLAAREAKPRKGFPILGSGGAKIDWQLVEDHGKQAQANHYQSVQRLAERGGLAWEELYAVLHNQPFKKIDANEAMIACRAIEARYLAALKETTNAA